jgi:hypothetical protein
MMMIDPMPAMAPPPPPVEPSDVACTDDTSCPGYDGANDTRGSRGVCDPENNVCETCTGWDCGHKCYDHSDCADEGGICSATNHCVLTAQICH